MSRDTLFFDLDGTLIDSEPGIVQGIAQTLEVLGHPPLSPATLRSWIGPPLIDSFQALFDGDGALAARAVEVFQVRYDATGWRQHAAYAGIPAAVGALQAAGHRLAVVTSKNEGFARRIIDVLPFGNVFETVVGASDDGTRRYKRELIGEALARLACTPSQCRMIGDRRMDIEGARQHGMRSAGVLWGFGTAAELRDAGADRLVDVPSDLPAALA